MPENDERLALIRAVRQRLESLRRAGLDRLPTPPVFAPVHHEPIARAEIAAPAPEAPVAPPPPVVAPPPLAIMPAATLFGLEGFEGPPVPAGERAALLATLAAEVAVCERCPALASTRTQTVFGTGSPTARLMFIGEAPGADEDRTGVPFVGRAGQLLTDMITKGMGLLREEVYIANILKSRPPGNRDPLPEEIAHCLPYLERQIAIIRPEFLCLLGRIAAQTILQSALPAARLRGRWYRVFGIPTIVTYHPAYLLRNPPSKRDAWDDLQMLMRAMGLQTPGRKGP